MSDWMQWREINILAESVEQLENQVFNMRGEISDLKNQVKELHTFIDSQKKKNKLQAIQSLEVGTIEAFLEEIKEMTDSKGIYQLFSDSKEIFGEPLFTQLDERIKQLLDYERLYGNMSKSIIKHLKDELIP